MACWAYALIVLGHAATLFFSMFLGISMADAFGSGGASAIPTMLAFIALGLFVLPAIVLLPAVPQRRARWTAAIVFGSIISVAIITSILGLLSFPPQFYSARYGELGVLLLLLWLRIDDVRSKL